MRKGMIAFALAALATPATAQPQAPPQLTDPALADKIARTAQALSQAFLNLPVGEVQAAVEGRQPSASERKLTVRDLGRRDDPNFDRDFAKQIANLKPTVERGIDALNAALPAITRSLQDASKAIERAASNMPDPTYPKR